MYAYRIAPFPLGKSQEKLAFIINMLIVYIIIQLSLNFKMDEIHHSSS